MKQLRVISVFILLATSSGFSHADATIIYSNEADVLVEAQTTYVQNGKVMIKNANNNTDFIYEAASNTVFVVDHGNRTVMRITEQTFNNLVGQVSGMASIIQQQLEARMSSMSAAEQAQMQAMMDSIGLATPQPSAAPPPPTLQTKGNAVHAGIACTINSVVQENNIIAEVCLSKGNNIGIANADYQALIGMQNFIFKMASAAQQFSGMLGGKIPSMGEIETENLIVQGTKLTGDRYTMIIIGVSSNSLPADTTAVPQGYTEQQLPSLSDLM